MIIASSIRNFDDIVNIIPVDLPTVFFDRAPKHSPIDTICVSDKIAVRDGLHFLINRGHRVFGHLTGPLRVSTVEERAESFGLTLTEEGIPAENQHLCKVSIPIDSEETQNAIGQLADKGCTAIYVPNEDFTFEVAKWRMTNGRKMAILGYRYNDMPLTNADDFFPIEQPVRDMARQAVKLLLARIKDPSITNYSAVLHSRFVPPVIKGNL
jgi:DNA-binding LacI/PurR family transcriptional regulator